MKKILMTYFFSSMLLFSGCSNGQEVLENELDTNDTEVLVIPDVGIVGGYEINTENLYCIVAVDGNSQYSKFESKTENHIVEFYADQTEVLLTDKSEATNGYYIEIIDDGEMYENPLERVFDELKELDFQWIEEQENYSVFQATKMEQIIEQEQIDFTKYEIEMEWLDGKSYWYSYYVYADDATMISAEAPDEINDRITYDTKWEMDIENECVRNMETKEVVDFEIVGTTTGKALSPNGSNTIEKEVISHIFAYVEKKAV